VVALTIDWEGAYLSPEGLDALDDARKAFGPAPLTHFVSAAYFTKANPDPNTVRSIVEEVHAGDEIAVHLHAWRSLSRAAGVTPKTSPSFLTGTDKLLEFADDDIGFDTDLDVYTVDELRALLRTSRQLLEQTKLPISKSFRAGGYLATPRVRIALRAEGFDVDSSATDHKELADATGYLRTRVAEVWPDIEPTSQPYLADAPNEQLLELPLAEMADYVATDKLFAVLEAAAAQLRKDPDHDVFVVLGFHQETAQLFSGRLVEAIRVMNARRDIASDVVFVTVERAARLARTQLGVR